MDYLTRDARCPAGAVQLMTVATVMFVIAAVSYPLRQLLGAGAWGLGNLPAFGHTAFFVALLAYPFARWRHVVWSVIAVAGLASGFEILQMPAVSGQMSSVWPPVLRAYAVNGTFDYGDLLATWVGAFTIAGPAWLLRMN